MFFLFLRNNTCFRLNGHKLGLLGVKLAGQSGVVSDPAAERVYVRGNSPANSGC